MKGVKRVLVGMSGGVDSSVAAYLLKQQGYDIVGAFIRNGVEVDSSTQKSCCSVDDAYDARRVADILGIPFYSVNLKDQFKNIINYFIDEYNSGRTPNPCAMCNRHIKFGAFFDYAETLGCDIIATGHYARISETDAGHTVLMKGIDAKKDQSYFLFDIKREVLGKIIFPLGNLTKDEIRTIATDAKLPVMNKPESQEICFVPKNDYRMLLKERGVITTQGDIITSGGKHVGKHSGHQLYTIGQREGLGVAMGKPQYVTQIDPKTNTVVIGNDDELMKTTFTVANVNWLVPNPEPSTRTQVKIRHNHKGVASTIARLANDAWQVTTDEPVRAITPGQAAVFYKDDIVLGGGWIQ